jgi:hypothetical protein
MWKIAERLKAYEATRKKSSGKELPPAFLVIAKLRPYFTTLMGNAGFRALLARALALAGTEVKWLRQVQVTTTGTLQMPARLGRLGPEELNQGGTLLIVELLSLLVAFIGEKLTLQMIRDVWPKMPLRDLDFYEGDKNEETK